MKRQRVLALALTLGLLIAPTFGHGPTQQSMGHAVRVRAGFDGNGRADLAVGVPYENVGTAADAGAINILYGSSGGLSAAGDQLWDQDSPNVEGVAEANDQFGYALAAGDFNGDGHMDLAIGIPGEDVGTADAAGAVHVLYGSATGLSAAGDQLWHQDVAGIEGAAEQDDHFGHALAAGDFNGDGRTDLAIGIPGCWCREHPVWHTRWTLCHRRSVVGPGHLRD